MIRGLRRQVEAALGRLEACAEGARATGYVYALRQEGTALVKIGMTVDPIDRILDLQRMNGARLTLVGLCHWSELEGVLHHEHADVRQHGEWFALGAFNPLPGLQGVCYGCLRRNPLARWFDSLDVPVVPVTAFRKEGYGFEDGWWFGRGEPERMYLGEGAGRSGALIIGTAVDQRAAIIGLALKAAVRDGNVWIPDSPAACAAMSSVSDKVSGNARRFWPGLAFQRAATPAYLIPELQSAIARLADLSIQLHLHTRWRARERLAVGA